MVEGARLESVCRGNPTVGSNPTLSANSFHCFSSAFPTKSTRLEFSLLLLPFCPEILSNSVVSQAEIARVTFPRDIPSGQATVRRRGEGARKYRGHHKTGPPSAGSADSTWGRPAFGSSTWTATCRRCLACSSSGRAAIGRLATPAVNYRLANRPSATSCL